MGVLALYVVVSVAMWWHVWGTGSPRTSISCGCGDPVQELWWLEWLPWAIAHGHNPFFTSALFSGTGGVNALTNTSALFPALVLAPITALFGPIASFNVIGTLAPVVSAYTMFALCRTLAGPPTASLTTTSSALAGPAVAGALYGFSPFVISNLPLGHIQLVLGPFPPLMALIVFKVMTGGGNMAGGGDSAGGGSGRRRSIWLGATAGGLIVLQYFTGSELLAITAVAGVVGLIPVALWRGRSWWARRREVVVATGAALLVAGPLLAYPLYYEAAGRRHTIGTPWPDNPVGQAAATIVNSTRHLSPDLLPLHLLRYFGALDGPPIGYVGWLLIAFLLISVVVWHRRPAAWGALVMGLVSWQLSIGIPAHSGEWTLWRVFVHIPVLTDIQPYRFSDMVFFSTAILLALSVAGWRDLVVRRAAKWERPNVGRVLSVVVVGAAIGALVPISTTYAVPLAVHSSNEPSWFRLQAPTLPFGTRVLTIPFPESIVPDAMAWQAEDDLHVNLVGGYALTPGQDGRHDSWVDPLTGASHLLSNLTYGVPRPTGTAAELRELYGAFKTWGVQVMVLPERFVNAAADAALLTAADGRLPLVVDGSYVWLGHGPYPFTHINPLQLLKCGSAGNGLAGPKCVAVSELAARVTQFDQTGVSD